MDVLGRVLWRATEMMKWLKCLFYEESLRELELFSLEKRRLRGILSVYANTWRKGAKKMEPGSLQWCPVTEQEASDRNGNTGGSPWMSGNTYFAVRVTKNWSRLPWDHRITESQNHRITESQNHRITESQNARGWKGPLGVI